MVKDVVISTRTALKAGHNLPLKVYSDNNFAIIDESLPLNFTKWDDANGILYSFRLASFDQSRMPTNSDNAISVVAVSYDFIQVMEVAPMPLKFFNELVSTIKASGVAFSNEFRDQIRYNFEEALHKDRWRLAPNDINAMTGTTVMDDSDHYYAGKFNESFKETRTYAKRNEEIDAEKNSGNSSSNP